MDPANLRFGGGTAETGLLPLTFVILLVASALILLLPRKYAALPFLLAALMIPLGQVIVVGGMHFMVFRILILVGWMRLIASGMLFNPRKAGFKLSSIDRAVLWWAFASVVTFTLLYLKTDAFINRMGFFYSTVGGYFLLRFVIRDWTDVDRVTKLLSVFCVVTAAFMLLEQISGRNVFAFFGGVPAITAVREGRIRSQGPFAHPIVAGTVGATLFPIFIGLWWGANRSRILSIMGAIAAAIIAITSASATSLMALVAGIAALLFWPFRKRMRLFRWGTIVLLTSLHLVMKAPVWALIARVDVVGGSSSYHRYELIDSTIRHFWDWWLLGAKETESWGYLMHDTANQYVDVAVTGGLISLVLFITIAVRCFSGLGLALKNFEDNPRVASRFWMMGACLFANLVGFIGISYFDQSVVYWYTLLVLIGTAVFSAAELGPRSSCGLHRLDVLPESYSSDRVRNPAKSSTLVEGFADEEEPLYRRADRVHPATSRDGHASR